MTQLHLAILIATATLGVAESTQGDEPNRNDLRTILELREDFDTQIVLQIPTSPIDQGILDLWRNILTASDAQMKFISVEYDRYVEQHNLLVQALGPRLWETAVEIDGRARRDGLDRRMLDELPPAHDVVRLSSQLHDLCHEFRQRMIATEQRLIDAIRPALTKEQLGRLATIQHESRRRNCRTYLSTVRWAHVELRQIWLHFASELASPQERQLADTILDEYEAALTPIVCRYAEQSIESRREYQQQFVALQDGMMTHQEFYAAYERRNEQRLETLQRIRQANEHALGRIVEVVSEPTTTALVETCRRIVFPEVYPDPAGLHEFLAAIIDDQHDEEVRHDLIRLTNSYESQHSDLSRQLEVVCVEWGDRGELFLRGYEPQNLHRGLEPKLAERRDLAKRYLWLLLEYLGPERMDPYVKSLPIPLKKTYAEWIESAESDGR